MEDGKEGTLPRKYGVADEEGDQKALDSRGG